MRKSTKQYLLQREKTHPGKVLDEVRKLLGIEDDVPIVIAMHDIRDGLKEIKQRAERMGII